MAIVRQKMDIDAAPATGGRHRTQAAPPGPERFLIDPLPGHIKSRYRRLALVACEDHMERLDANDEDTLIVSCNWLLWQKALAGQRHCIYHEVGLLDWTGPDSVVTDLLVRGNDWVFDGDQDPTIFRGVSLGRLFCGEVALCLANQRRLARALRKLIERFRPEEVLFFDLMIEVNVFDRDLRKLILESVVHESGIRFTDQGVVSIPESQTIAENPVVRDGHGVLKRGILFVYTRLVEAATNLRCLFSDRRHRVLVVVVSNAAEPLIRNFSGGGLTPIFLARTVPKKIGLLWRCLRHGILLVPPKEVPFTAQDRDRLAEIHAALEKAFAAREREPGGIVRAYVKRQILEPGRLTEAAADVCAAERLLERYRPRRIVVDGERGPPSRLYFDLSRALNIPLDHTWHSPLAPRNDMVDALGGDPRMAPTVTRCLTWGSIHESWLDAVGVALPRVRVGCPISDKYRRPDVSIHGGRNNALILQYTPTVMDLRGLSDNMFGHFVDVVRLLREHGYGNIRLKLHPGPGRLKPSFFKSIDEFFHLGCQILKKEPFDECVAWADIVIGPVQSGAMFETLASGKPYHAFLMPPHGMDPSYYGDYPIHSSVDEFAEALDKPLRPDAGRKLLNTAYSIDEYPSCSRRFWEVLKDDVA